MNAEIWDERTGTNPVDSNRVVYNGMKDDDEIDKRKNRQKSGRSKYAGPIDDGYFSILPNEICLTRRSHPNPSLKQQYPRVMSVMNGGVPKEKSISTYIEELTWAGISLLNVQHDSSGKKNEDMVALKIGGIHTMPNYGPEAIATGDKIYWECPDPNSPYDRTRKNSDRMPIWTMPFKVNVDLLTKESLRNLIQNGIPDSYEKERSAVLIDCASMMTNSFKAMFMTSIHLALQLGLVSIDFTNPNAWFDPAALLRRSKDYSKLAQGEPGSTTKKDEFFHNLARNLNLTQKDETNYKKFGKKMSFVNSEGLEMTQGLREAVFDAFMGTNTNHHIYSYEKASKTIPGGFKGEILNQQLNIVDDMFAAVERGNRFRGDRVFAVALKGAAPGRDMDVLLFK